MSHLAASSDLAGTHRYRAGKYLTFVLGMEKPSDRGAILLDIDRLLGCCEIVKSRPSSRSMALERQPGNSQRRSKEH